MSNLALHPSIGTHPGYSGCMPSCNVRANGQPVLLNPLWICFIEDHAPSIMYPQTDIFRVLINGMGAGMSYRSTAGCGAVLVGGSPNVMVGQ